MTDEKADKKRTVLFVCTHISGRSQMAEAFFNQLAGEKARAVSAGTDPDSAVQPAVVQVMRELGIDLSNQRPKPLSTDLMDQAGRVITMGCGAEAGCPATAVEPEEWELQDPKGKTLDRVRQIRDEIRLKVVDLLRDM